MSEDTTLQQNEAIAHTVKKLYASEKIVSYDLDFSKWNIKKLYKDTLWVKMLDEPDADTILKGGLYRPISQTTGLYRIAQVLMAGPDVKSAQVGDYIRFAKGIGSPYEVKVDGFKTALLREDQVMMVVEFQGDAEQLKEHLENDIYLQ